MRSGKLRFRVTLQRRVDTQQPGGQVKHTYTEIDEVWAGIAPLSGREFFAAQQVQSQVTTRINIRMRSDIDETTRVIHITNHTESPVWFDVYDVTSVLPDEKTGRRELSLLCIKRVAEGWRG